MRQIIITAAIKEYAMPKVIKEKIETNEWVKYSVNGMECERADIHKTICDNKFYSGKVNIAKKHHLEIHEKRANGSSDQTSNYNANFSLDTNKFTQKYNPQSDEYKRLIELMVHTVDMFEQSQGNYHEHVANMKIAIRNCFHYLQESLKEVHCPYEQLINEFTIEYFSFLFDMLAFSLGNLQFENLKSNSIPSLNFNTSGLKGSWDVHASNKQKSKYLNKYFSLIIDQTPGLCRGWTSVLSGDAKQETQTKFDEFKQRIEDLRTQKSNLDDLMPGVKESLGTKLVSFFHCGSKNSTPSSASSSAAPNAG